MFQEEAKKTNFQWLFGCLFIPQNTTDRNGRARCVLYGGNRTTIQSTTRIIHQQYNTYICKSRFSIHLSVFARVDSVFIYLSLTHR